ncbi:MAG: YciI family protein [Acidobacteriota bacterium]
MAEYMFLFHGGILNAEDVSPEEMQQHMQKWQSWVAELSESGVYEHGQPLQPGGKTVSAGGVVSDGPFAEAKEMVAGYFALDVATMNEAVEIAKDCPIYEFDGSVEVRQIFQEHGVTESEPQEAAAS